ncbi:Eco57I restriction-modification methylase domain-containing protein [Clostridium beijerinckii]|uniref:site-specific DNA-methyltransferase (adenine-specific) n=1 Tax=Clostridium beijerinckii TaxID=1520 RepID=A0AAW3W593_CLOBE|nr:DNA methyltransferase [Clostridium beijerinckii]MBC2456607.1 restriction endonuclease subunit M [Clostridium beijerinckii]MBC2473917.1 restriction endonuclease subunit M [Clostridium beijerinckii]NOV63281.1 type II restriction/modification system DNA methylase subunit YeeA [Clostridium beijerinckii]NOV69756.1 type II restriction/modification system DNA methylase subunit YeeA [Clostridium beijerinckii]NOW31337.1 type II restriction/modification system DNA methylase subunit YeeA [Clostridium 
MDNFKSMQQLVDKFHRDIDYYKNASMYNEHNCRLEFIDPMLILLGWDVGNTKAKAPQYREVITENYSSESGRPDYSMTLNGVVKFHVEAKKPSVTIEKDNDPAFQVRRYGWSSKLRISVLTNFEYLFIYDTTIPPKSEDNSNVAAIRKYHYTEYIDKFDEIVEILSKDTVYKGDFDNNLDNNNFSIFDKGLQLPIDEYFLKSINGWRVKLGNYLYQNKGYNIEVINDCIQEFINQIIFVRICEDRDLPLYHKLKELVEEETLKSELDKLFKEADKKYNSGLFSGEYIIFDLNNEIIRDIIEELYYPKSPYQFNLINPNILGEIYELFLAEHLIIANDRVLLEPKDKNLNRDIVTTPLEIVRYMVGKTLKEACKNKTPEEILNLRIADIACGSGIFLIETYDWLIRYITEWYVNNNISYLLDNGNGEFKLPFKDKKEVLEKCILGIDIDIHAVEVAKFNLMLKLLEGETEPSLRTVDKVLPDLKQNILYGNSLIDLENINYSQLSDNDKEQIVPFNWNKINSGLLFDIIIGNPPYVTTEDMKNLLNKKEVKTYKDKYTTSKGQYDKYFIFIERAIQKLKTNGHMCYIVPNKFSKIKSGEALRKLLSENKYVKEYIDFGSEQLFKKSNKTVYSSILLLKKAEQKKFNYVEVNNISRWFSNIDKKELIVESNVLGSLPWALTTESEEMELINSMYKNSVPLSKVADIFTGIQTSAERPPIYWFTDKEVIGETDSNFKINKFNKEYIIEKSILRKYFKPVLRAEKNLGTYDVCSTEKYIIFPYDKNGKLYDIDTMKNIFPNTFYYLQDNYNELKPKQIDKSGRRDVPLATEETWYQYGRTQALTAFNNKEKLIVGILSKKPMYIYDINNFLIASGDTAGYCAISHKEGSNYELEYIQAYLTHPYTEKLLSIIGSDFEGGFHSRGKSILDRLPFKALNFNNNEHNKIYEEVVNNSRRIYKINSELIDGKLTKSKKAVLEDEKFYLIKNIEELITKVYSI